MTAVPASSSDTLPTVKHDWLPILLPIVLSAVALPFIGNVTTWVTLTVAALWWKMFPDLRKVDRI